MELRAEIDRGEVVLARPQLDKDGHKKWKPPVADRPTITLFAHVGDHDVALCRWPTTIGGWKMFQKSDGTMALKYKESVTGDALWTEVLATPTWHPAPGMPTSHLLIKVGDTFMPKTEIIGPGYHAAYGLVAMVHKQIMSVNDPNGEPDLMDLRIRTHGTPGYRTVKRGESNGCHRLHNYEALRLAAFLIKHHANTRDGLVPEDYERHLQYKGQDIALLSESKGYRFKLTPPVPVKVLSGDVKGNAKSRQAHGAGGRGSVGERIAQLTSYGQSNGNSMPSKGSRSRRFLALSGNSSDPRGLESLVRKNLIIWAGHASLGPLSA